MSLGLITLHILLPGCKSLKEKRSRLKPFIARLHREFNISVAEIDHLDKLNEAVIACALISNDKGHTQRSLQSVIPWIEKFWPDLSLMDDRIELL